MQRAFLTLGDRQLHYRVGGDGSPVVMLHPSPLSSAAVMPVGAALARHFRVYAFDTPGYGQSEAPASRPASLDDYLPGFVAALDALGLNRVCVYGAATGAQFAVEFAKRHPERVALVVLDSAGHIAAEECEQVVRDYFPDVTPRGDGAHLATLWQMVRDLGVFFPWCDRRAQGVTVPAVLMRWEGSVVLRITDELIAAGLPPNYHVLRLGPTLPERIEGLASYLVANYRAAPAPAIPPSAPPRGRFASRYVNVAGGQLHLRVRLPSGGEPAPGSTWRIGLMGPTGAAALLEAQASRWPGDAHAALLDLAGSGDSEAFLPADATPGQHAAVVAEVLAALGVTAAQVHGWRGGAAVAIELALLRPALVRGLMLDPDGLVDAGARADALANEPREFAPRLDGTHLLAAWNALRDRRLWNPGYRPERSRIRAGEPKLDPRSIQRELLEVIKMGPRYPAARAAELQHAHEPRLALVGCEVAWLPADAALD